MPLPLHRLALLCLPLALMGCEPYQTTPIQERIELSTSEAVMSYRFAPGGTALVAADRAKLQRLLAEVGPGPRHRIVVSLPAAATAARTRSREAHLRGLLGQTGAQITVIGDAAGARRTRVEDQGLIRIIAADRMSVACPANGGLPAGCTQARNLAVMLDDPNDLILPRVQAPGRGRPKLPSEGAAGHSPAQRGTGPTPSAAPAP